jgi:hypothetical protein
MWCTAIRLDVVWERHPRLMAFLRLPRLLRQCAPRRNSVQLTIDILGRFRTASVTTIFMEQAVLMSLETM